MACVCFSLINGMKCNVMKKFLSRGNKIKVTVTLHRAHSLTLKYIMKYASVSLFCSPYFTPLLFALYFHYPCSSGLTSCSPLLPHLYDVTVYFKEGCFSRTKAYDQTYFVTYFGGVQARQHTVLMHSVTLIFSCNLGTVSNHTTCVCQYS